MTLLMSVKLFVSGHIDSRDILKRKIGKLNFFVVFLLLSSQYNLKNTIFFPSILP